MNELNDTIEQLTLKLGENVVLVRQLRKEVDEDVAAMEKLIDRAREISQ